MIEFTFYDNEATGVSVRHDQITQFGGVTCDASFRIKNSISKFVRLLPYVVPHPQALAVTRKSPYDVSDPSLESEYASAREIARFLTPARGTKRVFVTYNGIKYDDEILRTMLFRNLENPYFNSGRDAVKIDLLSVLRMLHAVDPEAVRIPVTEEGKPSFRLEAVCPANGIQLEAHDAYHDSVATMRLFALIQDKAPWAIDVAMECGSANGVDARLRAAATSGEPVFRFTSFGKPDFAPLVFVADDGARKHMAVDLRYGETTEDPGRIADQLYTQDTPFQVVTSNKFPLLLTAEDMLRLRNYVLPESLMQRSREINTKTSLKAACKDAVSRNTMEKVNAPSSEELIYGGFFTGEDKQRMAAFNRLNSWEDRSQVRFADPRLRDFSARIVLEAVGRGEAALRPEVVRGLAIDCGEALCRPFASAGSRYPNIADCLASTAVDEVWKDWARGRYGDHPVFDHAPAAIKPPVPMGQMSFGF